MRNNPFVFDPFAVVHEAFTNLYPGKDVACYWSGPIIPESGDEAYGETIFEDDGRISILVSDELKIADAVEILAHEFAHVAAGEGKEHGPEWEAAFDAIHAEYHRIAEAEFGSFEEQEEKK